MSQRDSGWIQLFAEDNQHAVDLHIQAFKLAEEVSLPVMVCMDGFILTHAMEQVDLPEQQEVDAFLPGFEPQQVLDPDDPVSIGAMVGPEAFTEVRYLAHLRQMQALELIPQIAAEYGDAIGRYRGGLVSGYQLEGARTIVVALGSVLGTLKDTVDELRGAGHAVGSWASRRFGRSRSPGAGGAGGRRAGGGAREDPGGRDRRRGELERAHCARRARHPHHHCGRGAGRKAHHQRVARRPARARARQASWPSWSSWTCGAT